MGDQIQTLRDKLDAAGLHTWEVGDGIINVYSAPTSFDGPDESTYLYTLTLSGTE